MLPRSREIEVVSFPSMNNERLTKSAKTRISNLLESCFSESAERIEPKSISFERHLKRKTAKIFVSHLLNFSLQKHRYGANLCLFNIGSAVQ